MTMLTASLPMYNLPEMRPQNSAFWEALAEEVRRDGRSDLPAGLVDELIRIPECHEAVLPIVATIPVQLLSYYLAVELKRDVDKPRNLAKSVTVE